MEAIRLSFSSVSFIRLATPIEFDYPTEIIGRVIFSFSVRSERQR